METLTRMRGLHNGEIHFTSMDAIKEYLLSENGRQAPSSSIKFLFSIESRVGIFEAKKKIKST